MDLKNTIRLFSSRRIWVIFFLGFASGLPLALTAGTLQAWLTVAGVDIVAIGLFGLVGQPYVYKFIWAPLFDHFVPPFLGRRRGWILIAQLCLVGSIAAMALVKPNIHPAVMGALALLTAFFSATQDIVFDAYRADILEVDERGFGAAVTVTGYRIAMIVSGALALLLASRIGWQQTYLIMSALMGIGIIATWFAPETERLLRPVSLYSAVVEPLKEFMFRGGAVLVLIFIVLYKMGDAFALSLSSTFLIRGLGFSLVDVGTVNKLVGLFATIIGAMLGGVLIPYLRLFKALLLFGILQAITNLMFMALSIIGKNYLFMVLTVVLENVCGGMGTAAFIAFLMMLCDHRYTAMQFALLSALAAIGRVFVGPCAGVMVKYLGWTQFYWWSFIIALPGLVLLLYLKRKIDFNR